MLAPNHRLLALASILLAGCPSDSDSTGDTDAGSSSSGDASASGPGTTTAPDPGSSSEGSTSGVGTGSSGDETTGGVSITGAETGVADSSSTGGGEESSSSSGGPAALCPQWSDTFDGAVDPVWEIVWPKSVEQVGGQTIITLTAATGDQYPRRAVPWTELGAAAGQTVRYRMTPAALPSIFGTQLNSILEGPAGFDVTFSLNYPGSLEYRLTTRADGEETLVSEGPGTFPLGGSVEFAVTDGDVEISILDDTGASVQSFAQVTAPFDLAEARIGFAGNNWGELGADAELAVEEFDVACE